MSKKHKKRFLPYPELVEPHLGRMSKMDKKLGRAEWTVIQTDSFRANGVAKNDVNDASVVRSSKTISVPCAREEDDWIRSHEVGHVRLSPTELEVHGLQELVIRAVEDCRVNHMLTKVGLDGGRYTDKVMVDRWVEDLDKAKETLERTYEAFTSVHPEYRKLIDPVESIMALSCLAAYGSPLERASIRWYQDQEFKRPWPSTLADLIDEMADEFDVRNKSKTAAVPGFWATEEIADLVRDRLIKLMSESAIGQPNLSSAGGEPMDEEEAGRQAKSLMDRIVAGLGRERPSQWDGDGFMPEPAGSMTKASTMESEKKAQKEHYDKEVDNDRLCEAIQEKTMRWREFYYDDGKEGPGEMIIRRPLLENRQDEIGNMQARLPTCFQEGSVLRRVDRLWSDGAIFGRRRQTIGGCTVLVDVSGSMSLDYEEVEEIILAAGYGATVAQYSGRNNVGSLDILAANGRFCNKEAMRPFGGGNIVDYHALCWLERQRGPRIWVSDGGVTGVDDSFNYHNSSRCEEVRERGEIIRVEEVHIAVKLLKEGMHLIDESRAQRTDWGVGG